MSCICHRFLDFGVKKFCKYAQRKMEAFLQKHSYNKNCCDSPDTWIYPLIQMGSFNIDMETNAMHQFLISTRAKDRLYLSTAYFNPSHEYIELITKKSNSEYHVLASAPEVRSHTFFLRNAWQCIASFVSGLANHGVNFGELRYTPVLTKSVRSLVSERSFGVVC